jgi:transposase-like protein
MESPNEQSHSARSDLSASQISARNHRVICAVVPHYRLIYRDLVEMMAERGVVISHSTIRRWVQRYVH